MHISTFDFEVPRGLVAQHPSPRRGESRLLVAHRRSREVHHTTFNHIVDFLDPGDLLVVNQTKVFPARLLGNKESEGRVEIVLLREIAPGTWTCLGNASRGFKKKRKIIFGERLYAVVENVRDRDNVGLVLKFFWDGDFHECLNSYGHIPLPPYIERLDNDEDRDRYQTIFSKERGAIAAPTAGLHWTEPHLQQARDKGIEIATVTLHVGYGTFEPIRSENVKAHRMHEEYFDIPEETVQKIKDAKRVVAVGTTTVRALESASQRGDIQAGSGWTSLFIYPGYTFKTVNVLQTNFHQPKSSLMVMVSAFAGNTFIHKCYQQAIQKQYRLFSYGDTMLIL